MGRFIPEDKPLSDEDRAFLLERRQTALVRQIDIEHPPGSDEDDDVVDIDADISEFAEKLTVAKLEDRLLKAHEADSSVVLPEKGALKPDFVSAYSIVLQDKRNAGQDISSDLVDE